MANRKILYGILIVAALLRLTNLNSGDVLGDESSYGFRAIGMLDFDEAGKQTTSLEWFDPFIPSWTSFSFHDHPPLIFLLQHISLSVFGESNFGMRFPSAVFGVASVYLLYLIGSILHSERVGLIAAGIFGATVNHAVISRLGIQESYAIFFILLASYFFLRALRKDTYFIWAGVAIGLGLLAKYTTGVVIPIFLSYILWQRHDLLKNKKLWFGALVAVVIFSPVLYYNYKLYRAVVHFDFQLSFVFHQEHPQWQVELGKEEFPTIAARAKSFFPNLIAFNSWVFLACGVATLLVFLYMLRSNWRDLLRQYAFLFLVILWLVVLIIGAIGPYLRFLAMLTPFFALAIAVFVAQNLQKKNILPLVVVIGLFEVGYSVNSQITQYPMGPHQWAWSRVRYENYNWGYNNLSQWLEQKFAGKMPASVFEPKYKFLAIVQNDAIERANKEKREPVAWLFVYDRNIQSGAQLWSVDRFQIYHAWPNIPADVYWDFLLRNGADYFAKAGFTKPFFIFPSDSVPLKHAELSPVGQILETQLREQGIQPTEIINNNRGEDAFRIYEL